LAQGQKVDAAGFFRKAVELDPANEEAQSALNDQALIRVARQTPADVPPPPEPPAEPVANAPSSATLEQAAELERVLTQQLTTDIRERQQRARDLVNQGQTESAINLLRLGQQAIRTSEGVPETVRNQLDREIQVQIQTTVRRAELLDMERVETMRIEAAEAQRARTLADLATNRETVNALMTQFDMLMAKGQYNVMFNGGLGDINATTAPFYDARLAAQHSRALDPRAFAPRAGVMVSQFEGFLAQALAYEELKEYRAMLTWNDVVRASVPFPDTITIEYPDAEHWRMISEKRIQKYESVSLEDRDAKTQAIYAKLDQPISMPFANETPLEDVIKYVKSATVSQELPEGIPIYVDPAGIQEADKTMQSPITLNLEGVSLKDSLKLLLKQLDLAYTVKDGLMTITYIASKDQPTEIRVYPVADLAMIPMSLMMGGGGGMMGGGMGGMGGGMMGGMG
ncbi:MAG TPA: hypothetical protein VFT74_11370, partial [Isosphaeraceae bacterium]|nr:hypothetical protein [Isosphaeraceae bacterium]